MARILLAALAAFLLCAPSASATVIVQRDIDETTDEFWAYDDAGGNGRLLIPDNFEPGLFDAWEPSTTATGGDVVFTGRTPRTETYGGSSAPFGACGRFCYGIYVLSGGAIRRITPPSDPCDGFPCAIFEGAAEIAPGDSVVFDRFTKLWSSCGSSWCTQDGDYTIASRPLTGGADEATVLPVPNECRPEDPAPHPTTAGLVLFEGCTGAMEGQEWKPIYYASTIDAQGAVEHLYFDDFPLRDPAWSADGKLIVDSEGGEQPGLWISAADGQGSQYVVALPDDEDPIFSPRFMGDQVVFVYKRDVYSIDPESCEEPCPIAQAKKLIATGDVASVTHTTASPQAWIEPDAGGDGGGGTVTPGPTPTPTPTSTPAPTPGPDVRPAPLDTGFALSGRRTLRGLLGGRLSFRLACDCAVTATLRLGRTVVAKGAGTSTVRLEATRAGRRKLRRLRRAKLQLAVRAGDRGFRRTLTLKR